MTAKFFRVAGFALAVCGVVFPVFFPSPIDGQSLRVQPSPDRRERKANIVFEENLGQFDPRVIFAGKGNGQTVFLTANEATFVTPMRGAEIESDLINRDLSEAKTLPREERSVYALKMKFAGANADPETVFENELEGKLGYFKGNDPSKWVPEVPRYGRVTSRNVYKGIDITWYENDAGTMEYDLNVAPGADPEQVRLDFDGADSISVTASGDLEIDTPAGPMYQKKPVVYQESAGLRRAVESGYAVKGDRVSFTLGAYDRWKMLVIDPLPPFIYSTYLGGGLSDIGSSVKADPSGNAYVTGVTYSTDFPITAGVNQANTDIFVTKLNSTGTGLYYSILIGGSGYEGANSIAIDGNGSAFITGSTSSPDFPVSWIAYDKTINGNDDIFAIKVNPSGTGMYYSTYIGGSLLDIGQEIAIDTDGSAYITGWTDSSNYPVTAGAYDTSANGNRDVFVTKLSAAGNSLAYSTYLGGSNFDYGYSLAVDSLGRAYVAGSSFKSSFPVTPGSYSTSNLTIQPDCFITKFNSAGSALVYSTVFGGDASDNATSIAIDSTGNAYITGSTASSNFPHSFGAPDGTYNSSSGAAFITKINNGGASLGYSSYLEGNDGLTAGSSIVADNSGKVVLVGRTTSATFPAGPNAFDITLGGTSDAFLVKSPTTAFSSLITATYLGGSSDEEAYSVSVNSTGFGFVTGSTYSTNYPVTAGVFDMTQNGSFDAFVTCVEAGYLP